MVRIKVWLIIISIGLICLDKFSDINKFRDFAAVNIQKQTALLRFRVTNYPKLILLQHSEQTQLENENRQLKNRLKSMPFNLGSRQIGNMILKSLKT